MIAFKLLFKRWMSPTVTSPSTINSSIPFTQTGKGNRFLYPGNRFPFIGCLLLNAAAFHSAFLTQTPFHLTQEKEMRSA